MRLIRFVSSYLGQKRLEEVQIEKPIFIVGLNNSGTTLIWQALKKSYRLCGPPNETQATPGAPECLRHPKPVRGRSGRLWATPEFVSYYYLTERNWSERIDREIRAFYARFQESGNRLIDKNPTSTLRMRLLQQVFPDAFFVGIVRDGLAVCSSIVRKRASKKRLRKEDALNENYDLAERAALHWLIGNSILLSDGRHLKRFLLVKYEDFVEQPEVTLRAIGNFCQIENPFYIDLRVHAGPAKNPFRDRLEIDRNERRIHQLEPHIQQQILNIIMPLMTQLGYR